MGMFDEIRFDYPLPWPEFQDRIFQTKDTASEGWPPSLDHIRIDKDGRFMRGVWNGKPGEHPESFEPFNGDVCFYDWRIPGETESDLEYFTAKFHDGLLIELKKEEN
jgi:hypothetical protein